jgi:hypothetical protein
MDVFDTLRDFVQLRAGAAILPLRAVARREGVQNLRIVPLAGAAFPSSPVESRVVIPREMSEAHAVMLSRHEL